MTTVIFAVMVILASASPNAVLQVLQERCLAEHGLTVVTQGTLTAQTGDGNTRIVPVLFVRCVREDSTG